MKINFIFKCRLNLANRKAWIKIFLKKFIILFGVVVKIKNYSLGCQFLRKNKKIQNKLFLKALMY